MPFASPSTRTSARPFEPLATTRTGAPSARPMTQSLLPVNAPPSRRQAIVSDTPRASRSCHATASVISPAIARSRSGSSAHNLCNNPIAIATDGTTGSGAITRPTSPAITPAADNPMPRPPASSGVATPRTPASARSLQTFASQPAPSSRTRRARPTPPARSSSVLTLSRNKRRSSSCSTVIRYHPSCAGSSPEFLC